ncbi:uncharacterized protein BO80DRAFT_256235 [Aspergillus ibericus CBS 121593]|uniref:Uncharacterized protein n=1 Tax=Aspergillus ibericus CBS 121593 TaxID=1448316 RepID=A0A395H873_9EURO|nr:hypothetical protein BO80DRAFT_256235 [Aspergillus ibericus CBS 121593]RAL04107.1 hypothetical protein BO80DRAFT_256235 [Aspergillus ibericus CBS 121593]
MSHSLPTPFTPNSDFAALDAHRFPTGTISITALARFEFEAGKANDGTKILMIEWEDDDLGRSSGGSWHVAWEGKMAVLPADEKTSNNTRRMYFLLPPNVTIPPTVTLSYEAPPHAPSTAKNPDPIQLNPLPAIFPPELGADGRSAGKKGVLHTIWAKKRLQVLEKEIHDECLHNAEGIALHMALQEKEWIETNFGVSLSPDGARVVGQSHPDPHYPMGPATPVSPSSGGKLGEKLRGLKLQTGERELSPTTGRHLLSPQSPDVAVSSFNSFHTIRATHPPAPPESVRTVVHYPPESVQAQQNVEHHTGFASLGTVARTGNGDGEELFAKALSPRTPDLPRSPFSFSLQM